MVCAFFGHRDAPHFVMEPLKKSIIKLIEEDDVRIFYVGNNGRFDFYVQNALREIKNSYAIEYFIVLSQIDEKAIGNEQERTIFPYEIAECIPRFKIAKRNEWIIKKSDFLICYAKYSFQNSYKLMKKAERRGVKITNLACFEELNV